MNVQISGWKWFPLLKGKPPPSRAERGEVMRCVGRTTYGCVLHFCNSVALLLSHLSEPPAARRATFSYGRTKSNLIMSCYYLVLSSCCSIAIGINIIISHTRNTFLTIPSLTLMIPFTSSCYCLAVFMSIVFNCEINIYVEWLFVFHCSSFLLKIKLYTS